MVFFPGMGVAVITGSAGGGQQISPTPTTVYLSSGTSWSIPSNYQPIGSVFDMYGGGGAGNGGQRDSAEAGGGGGGGGGFCRVTEFSLTPGGTLYYSIGAGGTSTGQDGGGTWINKAGNFVPTSSSQGGRAYGGHGGAYYAGGAGGGALYGSINRTGGNGSSGWVESISDFFLGYPGAGGGCAGTSSNGGNAYQDTGGAGGGGYAGAGGDDGVDGYIYGGGGGGVHCSKSCSTKIGKQGYLVITYYPYI